MSKNDRVFNISDATLVQHGQKVNNTLTDDIGDFTGFDSTITNTYPTNIKIAVDAVLEVKKDDVVIDEMNEKTEATNQVLSECNTTFKSIAYFVRKAFKGNKARQNQFGLNDIQKARGRKGEMILFMKSLNATVEKHKKELIAAGCNPKLLNSLPDVLARLIQASVVQETFMNERAVITQQRVSLLNSLYKLLVPVSRIAHIIYADNQAMLAKYALPRPKSSSDSSDDLIISEQEVEEVES